MEFNVNGKPLEGVETIDFCLVERCFVVTFENGEVEKFFVEG